MKVGELVAILKTMSEDEEVYLKQWDTTGFFPPTLLTDKSGDQWLRLDCVGRVVDLGDIQEFSTVDKEDKIVKYE